MRILFLGSIPAVTVKAELAVDAPELCLAFPLNRVRAHGIG